MQRRRRHNPSEGKFTHRDLVIQFIHDLLTMQGLADVIAEKTPFENEVKLWRRVSLKIQSTVNSIASHYEE